jgi:ABC-type glycerol-3-phosphate transport system substrate-binding protein
MMRKVLLGLIASLVLAGVVGCSNSQSSDKKTDTKQTQQSDGKKMNMTDDQMKNMKKSDNK